MITTPDFSFSSFFMDATGVVQAVLVVLILCSILCWAIIFEKAVILVLLKRQVRVFEAIAHRGGNAAAPDVDKGLAAAVLSRGRQEWGDDKPGETVSERRDRVERAMRDVVTLDFQRAEERLPYLATVGSAAPFVGLFGTVWGIMHAFVGIAQANDTSLAVVAPGIAEALFATAIGLVAAIPATVAYNKLANDFNGLGRRLGLAIAHFVRRLPVSGERA